MSNVISIRHVNHWEPYGVGSPDQIPRVMQSIHDEIERAAFGLFQRRGTNGGSALDDWLRAESNLVKPVPISIKENKDHLTVSADVPGFLVNELEAQVEGSELRICGKSEVTSGESSPSTRRVCCTVKLPATIRAEHATATLDEGVLILKLPKVVSSKKPEVKAAA